MGRSRCEELLEIVCASLASIIAITLFIILVPFGGLARVASQAVNDAMVFANKEGGAGWANGMVDNQGRYTIDVSPGAWMVSVGPAMPNQAADWTYGKPSVRVDFPDTPEAITRTLNFTVTSAGSMIGGRLLKPDGLPPV
ncbi:MAG: hypothetical protein Q7O66_11245 [Dehalococcoidia bacterium]|nr:hypothetical protein [Dehalococcoidia bacterium]